MTLSTHSVVGAGIAIASGVNPPIAFVLGVVSHFVLDAIPHWDYKMNRYSVGIDVSFSLFLVWFVFFSHNWNLIEFFSSHIAWGAFGAIIPDFLMGVHMVYPTKFTTVLSKFHIEVAHSKLKLDHMGFVGPAIQGILIVVVIMFIQYL